MFDLGKSVYKSAQGEKIIKDLYDKQAAALGIDFEDVYVDTRFGKTHIIKTGNPEGAPLILFHGGNSTAPYYLRDFIGLREKYLIYAPDTMGHPGKSAHTVLSAKTLAYGEWASDVITSLGYKKMICMGGSFGGGVLAKLMCVSPEKISKAVLLVPSGICNVSIANILIKLGIPMIMYIISRSEKWLKKSILPLAIDEKEIDESSFEMVRLSFENVCVKAGMPSNVKIEDMKNYRSPTLLIAGKKDIMFPGEKVIARAKQLIPNLNHYLMEDSGHLSIISSDKHKHILIMIEDFLES